MKKITSLCLILLLGALSSYSQTNATDFNATDCSGSSHHLFSELDAGKVIVIAWVMPCGACITDPLTAFYEVESYATSHPGQVIFYMADDYANTSCSSLESWAINNGMSNCIRFSDAAVDMADYGQPGMPKVVVLGGTDHKVYFNQNSSSQGIGSAIDQALTDIATGLDENIQFNLNLNTYPNPADNILNLSYSLAQSTEINIEIYNILGSKVISYKKNHQTSKGNYSEKIDIDNLKNGTYFLSFNCNNNNYTVKFTISH